MNSQKIVIPSGIGLAAVLGVGYCPDWLIHSRKWRNMAAGCLFTKSSEICVKLVFEVSKYAIYVAYFYNIDVYSRLLGVTL